MEAFRRMAKYPLVRACDMAPDVREEAVDICITAVEKHQPDMERITQVGLCRARVQNLMFSVRNQFDHSVTQSLIIFGCSNNAWESRPIAVESANRSINRL